MRDYRAQGETAEASALARVYSKIITRSTSATCSLDPIPTQFVKMFREELIHAITFVINESFR